jgi:hypothetical protein
MTDSKCEIDEFGMKRWFNEEGELHRLDGPAIVQPNGSKEWCVNGKLHRIDGPAVEWYDGGKVWWVNGKRHRLGGPAYEYTDGDREWYVDGKKLTKEQFARHPLVVFYQLSLKHESSKGNRMSMTDNIKQMIPVWITDEMAECIQRQFVGDDDSDVCKLNKSDLSNPKNWKRISKEKGVKGSDIGFVRTYDYKPADDQLRLSVMTNASDTDIVGFKIEGE